MLTIPDGLLTKTWKENGLDVYEIETIENLNEMWSFIKSAVEEFGAIYLKCNGQRFYLVEKGTNLEMIKKFFSLK
jgi:hypothetical protein